MCVCVYVKVKSLLLSAFLKELEFICLHIVKRFQVMVSLIIQILIIY